MSSGDWKPLSSDQLRNVEVMLAIGGVESAADYLNMDAAEVRARFGPEIKKRERLNEALKGYDIPALADAELEAADHVEPDGHSDVPGGPANPVSAAISEPSRALSDSEETQVVALLASGYTYADAAKSLDISLEIVIGAAARIDHQLMRLKGKLASHELLDAVQGNKGARRRILAGGAARQQSIRSREEAPKAAPVGGRSPRHAMPNPGPDGVIELTMNIGTPEQNRRIVEARMRQRIEEELSKEWERKGT